MTKEGEGGRWGEMGEEKRRRGKKKGGRRGVEEGRKRTRGRRGGE